MQWCRTLPHHIAVVHGQARPTDDFEFGGVFGVEKCDVEIGARICHVRGARVMTNAMLRDRGS